MLVYISEFSDNGIIGEFAERSLQRFSSTANLLRYSNHICYVTDVNIVFKWFRCSTDDKLFSRRFNLQRNLPKCKEMVRNIYPRSVFQLRETLSDEFKAFDIEVSKEKLLFTNFAVFDFESICVKSTTIANTETNTWVGEYEPMSVSTTSDLLEEPILICDTELQSLLSSFVTSSENLARKSKLEMGVKFPNIVTTIKEIIKRVPSTLHKR